MKKRKEKEIEYQNKYSEIPLDYYERLSWMYDKFKLSPTKEAEILIKRQQMVNSLYYRSFKIVLYEEPEGTPRPRFRLINRKNIANVALSNSAFVHVYSVNAHDDQVFMKRLISSEDFCELDQLIYTPCIYECNVYMKTPSAFNTVDTILSEIGVIRPIVKPDWDNIGKKYSDMFNSNIWLDDTQVISGTVNKYYSILPRVEINLNYLNMLYNKVQAKYIEKKIMQSPIYFDLKKEKYKNDKPNTNNARKDSTN